MALGATSSDIVTTRRLLQSKDGPIRVTQTKITFEFLTPGPHSRYRVPPGYTLHEATHAMLTGVYPLPDHPSYRVSSPISISTGSPPPSPPSSPKPHIEDGTHSPGDLPNVNNTNTGPDDARRARRTLRKATKPEERWYCITQGRRVGVFQGCSAALALTRGVPGSQLTLHKSRKLAEDTFAIALLDKSVAVIL
ncbi:hypothetical protein HWV62_31175 [Athelia sp. TMB]|nr:hypothetical protein HWV62_31175 [Athelia sp. TMB]